MPALALLVIGKDHWHLLIKSTQHSWLFAYKATPCQMLFKIKLSWTVILFHLLPFYHHHTYNPPFYYCLPVI